MGILYTLGSDTTTEPGDLILWVSIQSHEETWQASGDFDDIGTATFSPSGSKIAFLADQDHKSGLFIFDVTKRRGPMGPTESWHPDQSEHRVVAG